MKVFINHLIDASNAISHSDGLTVYDYIKSVGNTENTIVSFEGINRVSTAFLNAFIGKLIVEGSFEENIIDRDSTKEMILMKIDNVIKHAKDYKVYNKIVDDAAAVC